MHINISFVNIVVPFNVFPSDKFVNFLIYFGNFILTVWFFIYHRLSIHLFWNEGEATSAPDVFIENPI